MKSFRICTLMLALGTSAICSIPAHAQQEVDPDHFDQPSRFSKHVRDSKSQSHHSATAAQRSTNRRLASAHSHNAHHGQRS